MDIVCCFPSGSWMARRLQQDDQKTSVHIHGQPATKIESTVAWVQNFHEFPIDTANIQPILVHHSPVSSAHLRMIRFHLNFSKVQISITPQLIFDCPCLILNRIFSHKINAVQVSSRCIIYWVWPNVLGVSIFGE